ncbi:hypothetical protein PIB30_050572 [Stylosanthes scabra]|uniref:Uncharacterized protein n=1 Tax=Stylosanthes scabra TaxID=79078 RepID=A0ABU6SIS3_9FABA|nr:hypothetical protein [Stylosanthes scabra]
MELMGNSSKAPAKWDWKKAVIAKPPIRRWHEGVGHVSAGVGEMSGGSYWKRNEEEEAIHVVVGNKRRYWMERIEFLHLHCIARTICQQPNHVASFILYRCLNHLKLQLIASNRALTSIEPSPQVIVATMCCPIASMNSLMSKSSRRAAIVLAMKTEKGDWRFFCWRIRRMLAMVVGTGVVGDEKDIAMVAGEGEVAVVMGE